MKKSISSIGLCSALLLALAACNSSGSNGGKGISDEQMLQEAGSAQDMTQKVLPNNYTVTKTAIGNDFMKFNDLGCKTKESFSPTDEKDSDLAVGQKFRVHYASSGVVGNFYDLDLEMTVTSNQGLVTSYDGNYLQLAMNSISIPVQRIFSQIPNSVGTFTYTAKATGGFDVQSSSTPYLTQEAATAFQNAPTNNVQWECYVGDKPEDKNTYTVQTHDLLSYSLNGKMVSALLANSTKSGNVVCEKTDNAGKVVASVNLGQGTVIRKTIRSNDVIQLPLLSCGGATLYHAKKIVLDNGRVVETDVSKSDSPAR